MLSDGAALPSSASCQCFSALARQLLLLPLSPMWCLIFACNILPLLLPDDALQTCRVHLQKNVSVLDCVTPSTEEGLSHSKLAAGITKTKPRHLPALLRRSLLRLSSGSTSACVTQALRHLETAGRGMRNAP